MFENRNAHLNIFKAWNQQDVAALDGQPVPSETQTVLENNLTRALAITLERDQVFAARFAQMIERVLSDAGSRAVDLAVHALSDACSVNIEVPIARFEKDSLDAARLIPVVISAEVGWDHPDTLIRSAPGRTRVDLVVRFGDYLLIIECKRNGGMANDAARQLRGYLESIVEPEDYSRLAAPILISWQHILLEAQRLTASHRTHQDGGTILTDFVNYLSSSAGALGWKGDLRSFSDLLSTPAQHHNAIWRSAVSQRMEDWVREVAERLDGASIDEAVIGQRWCARLDWKWAREINFRIDCGNDLLLDRDEWGRSSGQDIFGVEGYLTVGDTLGQMSEIPPGIDPWRVGATDWKMLGFLGLMHFQGKGIHFVPLQREQSSHAWSQRRQMLRTYRSAERDAPPFPDDVAWTGCREKWAQYWHEGNKGFVVLTARVEFHRRFAVAPEGLPIAALVAEAFADLRRRFGDGTDITAD